MDEKTIGLNSQFYGRVCRVFGSANNALIRISVIDGCDEPIFDALNTLRDGGVSGFEFEVMISKIRLDLERAFVFAVVAAAVAEQSVIIAESSTKRREL